MIKANKKSEEGLGQIKSRLRGGILRRMMEALPATKHQGIRNVGRG
jgi:hypothetical protein